MWPSHRFRPTKRCRGKAGAEAARQALPQVLREGPRVFSRLAGRGTVAGPREPTMRESPDYRLVLRPLRSGTPAPVRLRRALKALLRCFGLKCLSVEEVRGEGRPARPAAERGDPARRAGPGGN